MKSYGLWLLILWCALTLETARTDLIPAQSLTLPVAVACMAWIRTGGGVLLGAATLLLRWLLQSSAVPLDVLIPVTVVPWLMSRPTTYSTSSAGNTGLSETASLAAVIAITIVAVSMMSDGWQPQRQWALTVGTALAVFLLLASGFRLAALLGLRRGPDARSAARLW